MYARSMRGAVPHLMYIGIHNTQSPCNFCRPDINIKMKMENVLDFDGYSRDWVRSVVDKPATLRKLTLGDAVAKTKGYFNLAETKRAA